MEKLTNNIDKIAYFDGQNYPEKWGFISLKQINCFIGQNNSGKSRKVREIFTSDISKWIVDTYTLPDIEVLNKINSKENLEQINRHTRTVNISKFENAIEMVIVKGMPIGLSNFAAYLYPRSVGNSSSSSDETWISDFVKSIINKDDSQVYEKFKSISWLSCYIPTLRSLRNLPHQTDSTIDLLKERTVLDYFKEGNKSKTIFTGHSLYQDLVKHLLGTHEQRNKVREYEKYLSTHFFFGQDISLVPMVEKDVVYFKEGRKPERPIYDLGDGIQSIIILTFPVFMADTPTMFFIEEPEHFLHAGLQRTLIETFTLHSDHMFFLTTHSNHILDLAQERDDISIQQVNQKDQETIVQPTKEYGDLLDNLGVRASSVLLANCSIWVEGVTDKLYLRAYLNKYIDELDNSNLSEKVNKLRSFQENLHYVFAEYQGSNITHWAFDMEGSDTQTPAKRLNKNILLIADADIDGKGDRVTDLKVALGESFHLLGWKEIENYIPYDILMETAKRRWETFNQRAGCSIERFSNVSQDRFEKDNEGIGKILEYYVNKSAGLERKFYSDQSGTIKDKVKFCHTAIKIMSEKHWKLTPQLKELCEKIWGHIEKYNS